MKGKNKIGTWVGFLLILMWCLFPVAWILSLSFKSEGETAVGSPQFLPKDPTFDNYKAWTGRSSTTHRGGGLPTGAVQLVRHLADLHRCCR